MQNKQYRSAVSQFLRSNAYVAEATQRNKQYRGLFRLACAKTAKAYIDAVFDEDRVRRGLCDYRCVIRDYRTLEIQAGQSTAWNETLRRLERFNPERIEWTNNPLQNQHNERVYDEF